MYVATQITSQSLSLTPLLQTDSHYSLFLPTFFRIRMRAPEGKVKEQTQWWRRVTFFLMEKTKNLLQCPSTDPDICSLYFRLHQRLFCKHDYVRVRSSALRAHKNANITFDHKYKGLKSTRTSSKFEMILFFTPLSNAEEVLLSG